MDDIVDSESTVAYNDDSQTIFTDSNIQFGGGQTDGGGAGGSWDDSNTNQNQNNYSDLPGFIPNDTSTEDTSETNPSDYQGSTFS